MELTVQQNQVFEKIKAFMESDASVFILRGYAGTGKTTMVKVVADYIAKRQTVTLMAPTGRAARVLAAKTGREAKTIHKAIYGADIIIKRRSKDVADTDLKFVFSIAKSDDEKVAAIVDESSMICSRNSKHELYQFGTDNLMNDLLTFIRPNSGGKVIFVGDPAQLPPVGDNVSQALRAEFFQEKGLKVMEAELTEVLRQKGDSAILKNAMMIRDLLKEETRNQLIFEEKEGDVETVAEGEFLKRYFENRNQDNSADSVVVCFSNKTANRYNHEIRTTLFGEDAPLCNKDILMVVHNNYKIGHMNGDFIPVLEVGARTQQTAPVYVEKDGKLKKEPITLHFIEVTIPDSLGNPTKWLLIEDLLTSDQGAISIDQQKALYINFLIRNKGLKLDSKEFEEAVKNDIYLNAIHAKYGYAVTGHKCQGGEWPKVFVDYTGRTGLSDDSLRWAYTATTRAQETLYISNLPHITPFSKFRFEQIQRCKKMSADCRILEEASPTPFHNANTPNGLRAKYHCIVNNLEYTPYSIHSVESRPYLETYNIKTPDGIDRYDLYYKSGEIFTPAKAITPNQHTSFLTLSLNDERAMAYKFNYAPSDELHQKLYDLIRSVCDTLNIPLTNVVEESDHSTMFYMRTNGTFSYLKIYFNDKGFVTYAKPMSMLGAEDEEFCAVVNTINSRLI